MIERLYTFTEGTFVVASDWNANFKAIRDSIISCAGAIIDANNALAFEDTDMTAIYSQIYQRQNSFNIPGTTVTVQNDCEYYKDLNTGEHLTVTIPQTGLNGQARVIIRTKADDVLQPVTIMYKGKEVEMSGGLAQWYEAGMKFIFIYEINGKAYAKIIKTGV